MSLPILSHFGSSLNKKATRSEGYRTVFILNLAELNLHPRLCPDIAYFVLGLKGDVELQTNQPFIDIFSIRKLESLGYRVVLLFTR